MTQEQRIKHNAAVKAEWERNGKRQRVIYTCPANDGCGTVSGEPLWFYTHEYYIHPADVAEDSYAVQMVKAIERGEEMQGRVRSTGIWIPYNDPKEVLVSSLTPESIRIKPKTKKVEKRVWYYWNHLRNEVEAWTHELDSSNKGTVDLLRTTTEIFEVPV